MAFKKKIRRFTIQADGVDDNKKSIHLELNYPKKLTFLNRTVAKFHTVEYRSHLTKRGQVFRKKIEMNAIKPNMDLVKGLPKVDDKRFAKRSIKSVNDKIDKAAADRFGSKSALIVADMMPVESRTRPLLYDGVTKEEKGRYQYLKIRHKIVPERKYQFPLLSSWEYGWKLGDVIKKDEIKKPQYGRTALIRDTFYTRNQIPQYPSFELMKSYTIV